mgnify:CR=1 FL=1
MNSERYLKLMSVLNNAFDRHMPLIIIWESGFKIRCRSITGAYETDCDPTENDYIGEYAAAVGEIELLEQMTDESVTIYNGCIEINLKCMPKKVLNENGTVLWESGKDI